MLFKNKINFFLLFFTSCAKEQKIEDSMMHAACWLHLHGYPHICIINVTEASKCIMGEEIPVLLLSRNIHKEEIVSRHIISDLRRINRPRPIWWLLSNDRSNTLKFGCAIERDDSK